MSIQKLADNLYIAPQLTEADVQEAAKLGNFEARLQDAQQNGLA